jgi:hypothetical protein
MLNTVAEFKIMVCQHITLNVASWYLFSYLLGQYWKGHVHITCISSWYVKFTTGWPELMWATVKFLVALRSLYFTVMPEIYTISSLHVLYILLIVSLVADQKLHYMLSKDFVLHLLIHL